MAKSSQLAKPAIVVLVVLAGLPLGVADADPGPDPGRVSATAVSAGPTTSPVLPQPRGDDPIIVARQDVLIPVSEKIKAWAEENDSQFAEIEIDAMTSSLHVYRVGGAPSEEMRMEYEAALPSGYTLDYLSAKLTAARVQELDRAVRALVEGDPGLPSVRGWGLDSVGGQFTIEYMAEQPPDISLPDVTFVYSSGATAMSRLADTTPYYGGNRLHGPFGVGGDPRSFANYSGGFGIRSRSSGLSYFTVPWHSWKPSDPRVWTNVDTNNVLLGNAIYPHPDLDVVTVQVSADNKIFSGGFPDGTTSKDVVGYQPAAVGIFLCSSGSYGYSVCDERTSIGHTYSIENDYTLTRADINIQYVYNGGHTFIWGQGDSGGPVFRNTSGSTQALAYGMISISIDGSDVPCPSGRGYLGTCTSFGGLVRASDMVAAFDWNFGPF